MVTGLPAHGEDPVAGGGFIRSETHGERHLDLTVDHPGEFSLRLRDAQHPALQAAVVERHPAVRGFPDGFNIVQLVLGGFTGHGVDPVQRQRDRKSVCAVILIGSSASSKISSRTKFVTGTSAVGISA